MKQGQSANQVGRSWAHTTLIFQIMGEERVLHSDKVEKDACVKQSPVTRICEEINRDCIDETISHYLLVVFNKAVYSESF